ncbi:MAG: hypothetical protein EHM91_01000 [Planctomycetota bacterium]|nr:MAG: hypothetical protein EHM91_01000 [Planctomycetota bacterium]
MKRLLTAISLVALAAGCGDRGYDVTVAGTVGVTPSETTDLLVQADNHDAYDYALWLEWQDADGAWNQTYLFSVYGNPAEGPTLNYDIVVASPETPYYVLLADPDGTLYDTYVLWLPYGTFSDVRFQVIGGVLVRPA